MTFMQNVEQELLEMKKLGIKVPAKAIKMAQDPEAMQEYGDDAMSVSDCADLLISLAL